MFEIKRKQGRPTRLEGEVGKVKIIRLVQELLRAEPQIDMSRKVIAQKIGVTPALITYYFPQKPFFFAEIATPIMEDYLERLRRVVDNKSNKIAELRPVIELLVELYGKDRKFIELYKTVHAQQGGYSVLEAMHELLADYLTDRSGGERPQSFEAAVLQGAVQGMCDFAARAAAPQSAATQTVAEIKTGWIDTLQAYFSHIPAAKLAF